MSGRLGWLTRATPEARRALLAAALGWMLDSFDVMLYALVLPALMRDLHLSKGAAGVLGSVTLVAAAVGGIAFGVIADRFGRTRALMGSVVIYAVFTAACGLANGLAMLAVFRVLLGFGMGGEWASGASLVAETWPEEHRGKALGLMQSAWAVGYALAALVTWVVLPWAGWRGVFFVGVAPALLTVWIRRRVREPEVWVAARTEGGARLGALFEGERFRRTVALTAMNACCLFAWWGFNLWVPAYLGLPVARGGVGLSQAAMTAVVVVMQAGMWVGYVTFGVVSDRLGRRRVYVGYLLTAATLLAVFGTVHREGVLLVLAPLTAFAATGYFTGFAAVTAELYETRVRATAQGFCYNMGRLASAAAPFAVGSLADRHGFGAAFGVGAAAFVAAAVLWVWIPETRRPATVL